MLKLPFMGQISRFCKSWVLPHFWHFSNESCLKCDLNPIIIFFVEKDKYDIQILQPNCIPPVPPAYSTIQLAFARVAPSNVIPTVLLSCIFLPVCISLPEGLNVFPLYLTWVVQGFSRAYIEEEMELPRLLLHFVVKSLGFYNKGL